MCFIHRVMHYSADDLTGLRSPVIQWFYAHS